MHVVSNACLIIYGHVCAFVDYTMQTAPYHPATHTQSTDVPLSAAGSVCLHLRPAGCDSRT